MDDDEVDDDDDDPEDDDSDDDEDDEDDVCDSRENSCDFSDERHSVESGIGGLRHWDAHARQWVSVTRDGVSMTRDGVSMTRDCVSMGRDCVSMGRDGVSMGRDSVSVGRDGVSMGRDYSRESSYARDCRAVSTCDTRESSFTRDLSRDNSHVRDVFRDNCANDFSRENSCARDLSREDSFVREQVHDDSGAHDHMDSCDSHFTLPVATARQASPELVTDANKNHLHKFSCSYKPEPSLAEPLIEPLNLTLTEDNAPIDLSVKKLPKISTDESILSRMSSLPPENASRPNFLPLGGRMNMSSGFPILPVRFPLIAIREQPADILSPVTESSTLLKSIYETTERAARASTAKSVAQQAPCGSSQSRHRSGVMMNAYLTERAIQDTFIKWHQYQATELSSLSPTTANTCMPVELNTNAPVPSTDQPTENRGMKARLLETSSSAVDFKHSMLLENGDVHTPTSASLKPKNYYWGKWHGTKNISSLIDKSISQVSNTNSVTPGTSATSVSCNNYVNSTVTIKSVFEKTYTAPVALKEALIADDRSPAASHCVTQDVSAKSNADNILPETNQIGNISHMKIEKPPEHQNSPQEPIENILQSSPSPSQSTKKPKPLELLKGSETVALKPIPKMTFIKTSSGTIIAVTGIQAHVEHYNVGPSSNSGIVSAGATTRESVVSKQMSNLIQTCKPSIADSESSCPPNILDKFQSRINNNNITVPSQINKIISSHPIDDAIKSAKLQAFAQAQPLTVSRSLPDAATHDKSFPAPAAAALDEPTHSSPVDTLTSTVSSDSSAGSVCAVAKFTKSTTVVSLGCLPSSAPSPAMNLTVLSTSDSKAGASFLSPSGVVPNSANK